MAVPGSVNLMMLGGGEAAVYPINQSLRFNSADSYTFQRTPGSDSTSQKKFTVSVWSKRGVIASGTTSNSGRQMIVYTGLSNGSGNLFGLEWRDDEVACIFNGAGSIYPQTVAKFRDPSAWYHIVAAVDTDQATDTDRCKIYVNGVQQTLTGTLPTSGFLVTNGTTSVHTIGELGSLRSNQYLAEAYYINDQQLTPSDFGELNSYGVWVPKEYAGTFTGTNSYYLKFDSAATNGIGHDHSGNGNNFTPSASFNTSGTGTDVMSDTPTNNFCTLNPLDTDPSRTTAVGLANGNLDASLSTYSSVQYVMRAATFASNGKDYFEVTKGDSVNKIMYAGFLEANGVRSGAGSGGIPYDFYGYYSGNTVSANTAYVVSDGTAPVTSLPALDPGSSGDVLMVAHDRASKKIWFGKNGTWFTIGGTVGNPATGTAPALTYLTDAELLPCIGAGSFTSTTIRNLNFGQRAFAYTPPTGFEALNTSNLPAPTVKDGSDYFSTITYSGTITDTSTQAVTGVGFQSDFTWIKRRDGSASHQLIDAVRGATKWLQSDNTGIEKTTNVNGALTSFDSDGFTLTGGSTNANECCESGFTYVAWNWKANGSGSLNEDGSIDSTVSADLSAGFSIVSWAAEASAGTVGHGLGVAPQLIVMKDRDTSSYPWLIYHQEVGIQKYIPFSQATPVSASTAFSTAPTTTLFDPGTGVTTGNGYGNLIAYCFAEIEGYSKFGSYTGNASDDGTFVYCGFRPAFVLIKRTDANSDWIIIDAARNLYNAAGKWLLPNSAIDEYDYDALYPIDILSNGFKLRTSVGSLNTGTFVYGTFAENPFGGSGVSPATAR